jgi:hypothetical protein
MQGGSSCGAPMGQQQPMGGMGMAQDKACTVDLVEKEEILVDSFLDALVGHIAMDMETLEASTEEWAVHIGQSEDKGGIQIIDRCYLRQMETLAGPTDYTLWNLVGLVSSLPSFPPFWHRLSFHLFFHHLFYLPFYHLFYHLSFHPPSYPLSFPLSSPLFSPPFCLPFYRLSFQLLF